MVCRDITACARCCVSCVTHALSIAVCRLGGENRGLQEELERVQQLLLCWESQAQSSLSAEERLKEMLEEAAGWQGGSSGGVTGASGGKAAAALQAALLAEKARAAGLELQVRMARMLSNEGARRNVHFPHSHFPHSRIGYA
jgi:hypothetical protein